MRLITPTGVRMTVSDERGEALKQLGYSEPGAAIPAAPRPAPVSKKADSEPVDTEEKPVRRRSRKTDTDNNE